MIAQKRVSPPTPASLAIPRDQQAEHYDHHQTAKCYSYHCNPKRRPHSRTRKPRHAANTEHSALHFARKTHAGRIAQIDVIPVRALFDRHQVLAHRVQARIGIGPGATIASGLTPYSSPTCISHTNNGSAAQTGNLALTSTPPFT